jgi:hypothetical protein
LLPTNPSRVWVTALSGLAIKGRALDSSPNSSSSDTIKHRVLADSLQVRIEVRDESSSRSLSSQQPQKATAKTKTPNNTKTKGNSLDFLSRLIEAAEGAFLKAAAVSLLKPPPHHIQRLLAGPGANVFPVAAKAPFHHIRLLAISHGDIN